MLKVKQKGYLFILSIVITLISISIISYNLFKNDTPAYSYKPNKDYKTTLKVVTKGDFQPYSFVNKDGYYSGFNIEVMAKIADILKVNLDIELVSWSDALDMMKEKKADVILAVLQTPENTKFLNFSLPISRENFVFFGKEKFNPSAIYNSKVAHLDRSITSFILYQYGFDNRATPYKTYRGVFESVKDGETDYLLSSYSAGRRLMAEPQFKDIKNYDVLIHSQMTSFGVAEGDSELLQKINSAVLELRKTNAILEIETKWLGNYVELLDFDDIMTKYSTFFAYVVAINLLFIAGIIYFIYSIKINYVVAKKHKLERLLTKGQLANLAYNTQTQRLIHSSLESQILSPKDTLFVIDIDNSRFINDIHGSKMIDTIVSILSETLEKHFPQEYIITNTGMDEFCVFAKKCSSIGFDKQRIEEVVEKLNKKLEFYEFDDTVTVSVGIASFPEHGSSFKELYDHANEALYQMKHHSKNRYVTYDI